MFRWLVATDSDLDGSMQSNGGVDASKCLWTQSQRGKTRGSPWKQDQKGAEGRKETRREEASIQLTVDVSDWTP